MPALKAQKTGSLSEASTPPSLAEISMKKKESTRRGPKTFGACYSLLGILPPRGEVEAITEQWKNMGLTCALLTTVASAGMYASGGYCDKYRSEVNLITDDWSESLPPHSDPRPPRASRRARARIPFSQSTIMGSS